MTTAIADEVLDKALRQPETDRVRIAEALIASLDAPSDREVERAWQLEIDKRLHEIDTGTLKCVPWEDVRDRLSGVRYTKCTNPCQNHHTHDIYSLSFCINSEGTAMDLFSP